MPVLMLSGLADASSPQKQRDTTVLARGSEPGSSGIDVGLVNNMPDAAVDSTERQFVDLLNTAAGEMPVRLRLFSLSAVSRSQSTRQRMHRRYEDSGALLNSRLDALIVTGTEPQAACLQAEPYWESLTRLVEWAHENTTSTIWSCLAAHAAVLHLDGIPRHLLEEKLSGVFACATWPPHPLLAGLPSRVRIAHSRLNELRADSLRGCNYRILTQSDEARVDTFVKQQKSLFVFFQGHPEYDRRALLREYRRDIGRFLRGERKAYPAMPRGYVDPVAADALARFEEQAVRSACEELLERFPFSFVETRLLPADQRSVTRLYANWLAYVWAQKEQRRRLSPQREPIRLRPASASQSAHGIR